ncbi:MAG: phage tail protein [Alphaproteobacteria bacterium]
MDPAAAKGGVEGVALALTQIPYHTHAVNVNNAVGNKLYPFSTTAKPPTNHIPAQVGKGPTVTAPIPALYGGSSGATTIAISPLTVGATGGGAAHENRQPYLALNYCIATTGIYPPRD